MSLIGCVAVAGEMCSICILQAAHSVMTLCVGDAFKAVRRLSEILDDRS